MRIEDFPKVRFHIDAEWWCRDCDLKQNDPDVIHAYGEKPKPICRNCGSFRLDFLGTPEQQKLWERYEIQNET